MDTATKSKPDVTADVTPNVQQVVPFFRVSDLATSLRFYIDGLGFTITKKWIDEGQLRWCWLQLGGAAIMLQEFRKAWAPSGKVGEGVSICFQCRDALELYRAFSSQGLQVREPFVGNSMWVTILADPDGYTLDFESPTDVPEETKFSDWKAAGPSKER
jgi:lactoylglutathione lyase